MGLSLIVFFDGECAGCSAFVRFLFRHDKKKSLFFAPLQGAASEKLLGKTDLSTVVFLEGEKRYEKSDAVLKILHRLGMPWSLFSLAWILPRSIRNRFYDLVARNRFWLSNRVFKCELLTPEENRRLL